MNPNKRMGKYANPVTIPLVNGEFVKVNMSQGNAIAYIVSPICDIVYANQR